MNDFVVQKIAVSLPNLVLIDLRDCASVTEQAPLHLKSKFVKPEVLVRSIHELNQGITHSVRDVAKIREGLKRVEERPTRVFSPSNPELIEMVTKMQNTIQR